MSPDFFLDPVAHHSSFFDAKHRYPIPGEIPSAGALNRRVGRENLRISVEIAVYLRNSTR